MGSHTTRLFSFLFLCLTVSSGSALATTRAHSKNVNIKPLLRKMSRAELMQVLDTATLSDSIVDDLHAGTETTLLFEPVEFEGTRALIEATLLHDSTTKIEVYAPYIGHDGTRLKVPFHLEDFIQGSLEDYNQMERSTEDELGIPTVLTGTTFEYLNGNTQPIFGVFNQERVQITIIPTKTGELSN